MASSDMVNTKDKPKPPLVHAMFKLVVRVKSRYVGALLQRGL
jgi:hypothetical protein